jgi:hypothetical protein
VTGLTSATFKFAAGRPEPERQQQSSTWLIRLTRGGEIYVTNRDAGGQLDLGHISFHADGRCHAKLRTVVGSTSKRGLTAVATWDYPPPDEGTGFRRLLEIHISSRDLIPPEKLVRPDDDTILLPPPPPGWTMVVVLIAEPGTDDDESWPGRHDIGTDFVARSTLYSETDGPVASATAVWHGREVEDEFSVRMSEARVEQPEGSDLSLRTISFRLYTRDDNGAQYAVMSEGPIGHMYSGTTSASPS